MRHSCSHVMAHAITRLYPGAEFGVGPDIENGFYYDVKFPEAVDESILPKIEVEMRKIIKEGQKFDRRDILDDDARVELADEPAVDEDDPAGLGDDEQVARGRVAVEEPVDEDLLDQGPDEGDAERLAVEAGNQIGRTLPMLEAVREGLANAVSSGLGEKDWSIMADMTVRNIATATDSGER